MNDRWGHPTMLFSFRPIHSERNECVIFLITMNYFSGGYKYASWLQTLRGFLSGWESLRSPYTKCCVCTVTQKTLESAQLHGMSHREQSLLYWLLNLVSRRCKMSLFTNVFDAVLPKRLSLGLERVCRVLTVHCEKGCPSGTAWGTKPTHNKCNISHLFTSYVSDRYVISVGKVLICSDKSERLGKTVCKGQRQMWEFKWKGLEDNNMAGLTWGCSHRAVCVTFVSYSKAWPPCKVPECGIYNPLTPSL